MKASEKQQVARKIVAFLKKELPAPPKKPEERNVIETLLYAVGYENATLAESDLAAKKLDDDFFDLNELRVSTITELRQPFAHLDDSALRAHRVRCILQGTFEDQYNFDLDGMRKKTLDQALKQLKKIRDQSPFVRLYCLKEALSAHVVPLDDLSCNAAIWCGLIDVGTKPEQGADVLKSVVRKPDASEFFHYLHDLASAKRDVFHPDQFVIPEEGFDPGNVTSRLPELFGSPKKTASAKPAAKKSPAEGTAKKSAGSKKATTKKSAKKKPASKKSTKKAATKSSKSAGDAKSKKKATKKAKASS
ncbi:hypothetical protein [Stratiformator vulcanicus]|uniref:Uncharacterized protein n=1 Tax=Stratiformator vulcanicus TaxID=2527980 RepID=A0A517R4U5_9PLAN|nr:hypothetical protein [Stratiformator vulcanicus]QDT38882.1 hypothetical protein Pan189_32810 [Stratiformator vulcanicus]